ncbi:MULTISPECIES: DUF4913 domain-containing protein [unclassified Streptomyces]|uniref:DUF4913 domain-containing protein n=1 Tax=unclassified Streptomyces TaxID=2593676 RepID=UPI003658F3A4
MTTEITEKSAEAAQQEPSPPHFILYKKGSEYAEEIRPLTLWVNQVLLPVYGRETTSALPWCSCWWEHPEAIAQLHALWLTWAELTGPGAGMSGAANWHRDYLGHVMTSLRDPQGPFAGCKPGKHRAKEAPPVDEIDPFGPPPSEA